MCFWTNRGNLRQNGIILEYAKSQFLHLHLFNYGSTPRFAASGFDPEKHAGN